MRRRRRLAIDTHDAVALRGVARRTRLMRLVLAAAAVGALVATVVSVLDAHRRTIVPAGSSGVIVVDVSLSIANSYGDVRRSLRNVMNGDSPVGLVVFSDVAYELFPRHAGQRTRARARRHPAGAWRPSDAVDAELSRRDAHLRRARARRSNADAPARRERVVVLISDLQTAPDDVTALARTIVLKSRGVAVRVVPIGALSDGRLLFTRLLGKDAFSEPTRSIDGGPRPLRSADSAGLPVGLLTLATLFFLALAAHERYASRLALPRSM